MERMLIVAAALLCLGNAALPIHAQEPPKTASWTGHSLSFKINAATANPSTTEAVAVDFFAYDGDSGQPADLNKTGEVKPEAPGGVYRVDYHANRLFGPLEYGFLALQLPSGDSGGNSFPDFLEKDRPAAVSFGGTKTADWPDPETQALTGTMSRSAGSTTGDYTLEFGAGGQPIRLDGTFRILSMEGTIDYSRGANPNLLLEFSFVSADGALQFLSGATSFTVLNADQIVVPQMFLNSDENLLYTLRELLLERSGNRYMGAAKLADGHLGTSVKDFTQWIVEIVDSNDSDGDGIPDLSDALNEPPEIITQPQGAVVNPGADVAFSVVATGGVELFYQWRHDGTALPGATSHILNLVNVDVSDAGTYSVVVRNNSGETVSNGAVLFVNRPPQVQLVTPTAQAVFAEPASVLLNASAADPDGSIAKVDFFNGVTLLHTAREAPFAFAWNNLPAGVYTVAARATDNLGASSRSADVQFVVTASQDVRLLATRSGGSLLLSWPKSASGFALESSARLGAASASWAPVSIAPVDISGTWAVIIEPSQSQQFFRLRRP